MKNRQKHSSRLLKALGTVTVAIFVTIYALQMMTPTAHANPDTIIDSFNDTTQTINQNGIGTNSAFDDTPGTDILAGERDAILEVTGVGAASNLNVFINGGGLGQLAHSQDSGVTGRTTLIYDGDDDDGTTLSFGLGSVNLNPDNTFVIELIASDLGVNATITYYTTDATNCSSQTLPLPVVNPGLQAPVAVVFPFSGFTTACAGAGNINDVDAITLEIDGTGTAAADVTIDLFKTAALDYGDLPGPAATFDFGNTTLPDNGAGHVVGPLFLGTLIDAEPDGQEDTADEENNEDDTNGVNDEDGVVRSSNWTSGGTGSVDVTSSGLGCLSAWVDFSDIAGVFETDGDFDDAGENIIDNVPVIAGTQTLTFTIPVLSLGFPRGFHTRFRLFPRDPGGGCTLAKDYVGQVPGGEVEDYWWDFGPTAVTLDSANVVTSTPWYLPLSLLSLMLIVGCVIVKRKQST